MAEHERKNRLRELREQNQLTQETLAYLVGVTKKAYIAWELGRAAPRPRHAKLLARRLGVTVDQLGLAEPVAEEQPAQNLAAIDRRIAELQAKREATGGLSAAELRRLSLLYQEKRVRSGAVDFAERAIETARRPEERDLGGPSR